MNSGIGDDLRTGLDALVQVLEGAGALERAATSAIQKADVIVEHVGDPETIQRVAAVGLGAAIDAVGREVHAAASKPRMAPPAKEPTNIFRCRKHGRSRWEGTIVCDACGLVFQVLDRAAPRFAPERCPCGVRLMPGAPGETFRAAPICSTCFVGIAASGGRAVKVSRRGTS